MSHVAWLGTGLLGAGFVEGLRKRGLPVHAWNRTAAKVEPLVGLGAVGAPSVPEAVRGADRVHLCLSDDDAVDAVLREALPALEPGALVVDHSTVSPTGVARRAERMASAGVTFLHAPVFMAPMNAREHSGIILGCGPTATWARAEPLLRPMTGKLLYLGERPDKAAAFKLFGNALIMALAGGVADVLTMARGAGIEPVEAMGLFKDFIVGRQLDGRGARMARGDFEASFELAMARKDVRLMLELARAVPDMELTVLPAVAQRMDNLIAAGEGPKDLGVLARDVFGPAAARGRRREP